MKTKSEIWFEKLKDVWLRRAVDEIGDLMAEDFEYYEDPFDEPITSVEKLVTQWQEVKAQEIELVEIESLIAGDTEGSARYHFVAMVDGKRHESKGAYFVRLTDEGKATEFRQWWNSKE